MATPVAPRPTSMTVYRAGAFLPSRWIIRAGFGTGRPIVGRILSSFDDARAP